MILLYFCFVSMTKVTLEQRFEFFFDLQEDLHHESFQINLKIILGSKSKIENVEAQQKLGILIKQLSSCYFVQYTRFFIRNWFMRNEYYTGRKIKKL